jgi:hypothetical protein
MNTAFTVVYDANVLFSARLRDFLVRLAMTGLFRAKWTDDIHREWMRAVRVKRPHVDPAQLERTRDLMNAAVRNCLVDGYDELIETLTLPGPTTHFMQHGSLDGTRDFLLLFRRHPGDVRHGLGVDSHPHSFLFLPAHDVPPSVKGLSKIRLGV